MLFKVCAVINTLNRPKSVVKCLNSLHDQANLSMIIVVDDGSKPPLKWALGKNSHIPWKVLRNEKPIGCCQTRNQAVRHISNATHVFFVDDDEVIQPNCLKILCDERVWSDPKVAATGGSVVDMVSHDRSQNVWAYAVPPMKINNKGQICDLSAFWVERNEWYPADHLRGGNLLVRLERFKEVGGYSKEWGVSSFRGETDFALKLREKGYKLMFNPSARALHYRLNYGGLRATPDKTEYYDKLWRKKWKPKHFLGDCRSYPPRPCYILRKRR